MVMLTLIHRFFKRLFEIFCDDNLLSIHDY